MTITKPVPQKGIYASAVSTPFTKTYYIIGEGFTNSYSTENAFHIDTSSKVSPGGSVLVGNGSVLLSERDAAAPTNAAGFHLVTFESDVRSLEGWTCDLEEPSLADAEASIKAAIPLPFYFLRVKTNAKTGCRVPLYSYAYTNTSQGWRQGGGWERNWPIRSLGYRKNSMVIWNGLKWQDVSVTNEP